MDKERIRSLVEAEFSRQINPINEGLGRRMLSRLKYNQISKVYAIPFVVAASLLGLPILYGLGIVAAQGMWMFKYKEKVISLSTDVGMDLAEVTKKRDKIIADVEGGSDPELTRKEFESLTAKQISYGTKLEVAAKKDLNSKKIDQTQFDEYMVIIDSIKKGQFSLLAK